MSLSRLSPVFRAIAEDPFFARLPTLFNEPFFNEVARPAMARLPSLRVPALDVKEQDTSFLVEAEVPGVAKKDIDLSISDNTLVIRGTVNQETTTGTPPAADASGEASTTGETAVAKSTPTEAGQVQASAPQQNFWSSERVFGTFSRSFTFPVPVKTDGVSAKLENGVLKVVVPKLEEAQPGKKIEIEESA